MLIFSVIFVLFVADKGLNPAGQRIIFHFAGALFTAHGQILWGGKSPTRHSFGDGAQPHLLSDFAATYS